MRVCVGRPLQVGVIAGVLVAFILLIAIAVVVVIVFIRRRRRQRTPPPPRPMSQHVPVVKDAKESVVFPRQSTKPIALSKFRQHVAMLEKDTNLEYSKEYEVCLYSRRCGISLPVLRQLVCCCAVRPVEYTSSSVRCISIRVR